MSALEREIRAAEYQHLDLPLRNVFEEGGRAVSRLGRARADAIEDDPSHDEIGDLGGETQNRSATADLDVVRGAPRQKQL